MAKNRYEYSTSPKKIQPDIRKNKSVKKRKLEVVKDNQRPKIQLSKEQKNKQIKLTFIVIGIFIILLTISYRNSQINEKFNQVQKLKTELSLMEKENAQLKVSIENSINSNNIERQAKEKLGMQKLTNKQTVYITLPKKDYTEAASEKVVIEEEKSWFQNIIEKIFK